MKQLTKQSMKELLKYALEMPVGELQKYGTLFLSGPVPATMTRGELIALQLVERASYGDLDAVKEIRNWIVDDPKSAAPGGDTYYQFLIGMTKGETPLPAQAAEGLQHIAKVIEAKVESSKLLDDLE